MGIRDRGTDGASSNNKLDRFAEIKRAALLQSGANRDPKALSAWDALYMATTCGARALGRTDTGALVPGNTADLIALDFEQPHLAPCHDALENLVYSARGSDVVPVSYTHLEVTYLPPHREGTVSLSDLEAALRPETALVSMMLVNNEVGTVLPVREAAALVKRYDRRILFHTDAVQGFLKLPFTPAQLGVDLLSRSGHKVHAPKGIGALYIRSGVPLKPLILGGGQENGLRSGTEPTAQIAAFAAACQAVSYTHLVPLAAKPVPPGRQSMSAAMTAPLAVKTVHRPR